MLEIAQYFSAGQSRPQLMSACTRQIICCSSESGHTFVDYLLSHYSTMSILQLQHSIAFPSYSATSYDIICKMKLRFASSEVFGSSVPEDSILLGSDASVNKVIPTFRGNLLSSPSWKLEDDETTLPKKFRIELTTDVMSYPRSPQCSHDSLVSVK
jgi:hypothetical protein